MSWDNRVAWTEGLFLRPEHLQQADRYSERFTRQAVGATSSYGWGFTSIRLNTELLAQGKIGLVRAEGVMDDGTPFALPEDADQPPPYAAPKGLREERIYLCVPLRQPGASEVGHASPDLPARLGLSEQDVSDTVSGEKESTVIDVVRLRFRILPESAELAGYSTLPIARVTEVRTDGSILLDETHVPPALDCGATPVLSGYLSEIAALLHHRGEALAGRIAASGTQGVAEITDFMLLQLVNRHEPLFQHLARMARLHPESAYRSIVALAGELGTFARTDRRCTALEPYDHNNLAATFRPPVAAIRSALNAVLEQTAIAVPMRELKYGVHLAEVADRSLFTTAKFLLAVRANVAADRLRREFPPQVKIGPAAKIRELVNVALPGIAISPLAVAPRQIPFAASTIYFEVDQTNAYWKDMTQGGGLALHVSGDFQDLEMGLWAIRGH